MNQPTLREIRNALRGLHRYHAKLSTAIDALEDLATTRKRVTRLMPADHIRHMLSIDTAALDPRAGPPPAIAATTPAAA